jgi:hypothetical protein
MANKVEKKIEPKLCFFPCCGFTGVMGEQKKCGFPGTFPSGSIKCLCAANAFTSTTSCSAT